MSDYNDEDRRDLSPDQARVYRNYLLTCRRLGVMPTSPERAKVLLEEWAAACRDATQLPARSMSESQSCGTRPPGKRNPPRRAALSHSGAQALRCWAAFIRVLDLRGPEFSPHRHEAKPAPGFCLRCSLQAAVFTPLPIVRRSSRTSSGHARRIDANSASPS